VGKLLLTGNEPVKSSDAAFVIIQPAGSEIQVNGTSKFTVNFNPLSEDVYTTTIAIKSNDPSGDFSFSITAKGVTPKPIINVLYGDNEIIQGGSITVKNDIVISKQETLTITIKNTGDKELTLSDPYTISDETLISKLTSPSTLVPVGGQTNFMLDCHPTKSGENTAIITIPSNDQSKNPFIFTIKVNGIRKYPAIELKHGSDEIVNNFGSTSDFSFGEVEITNNKTEIFTIKNTGDVDLVFINTPIFASSNSHFSATPLSADTSIASGESMNFSIAYTPTAEEANSAEITVASNTQLGSFKFIVNGNGYVKKPQIQILIDGDEIAPVTGIVEFPTAYITKTSRKLITIKNTGYLNLELSGAPVTVSGENETYFTILNQPAKTITPGNSTNFTVEFTPEKTGDITAQANISSNSGSNESLTFILKARGEVGYSDITVKTSDDTAIPNSTGTLAIEEVAVGASKSISFILKNNGTTDLHLTGATPLVISGSSAFTVVTQPKATLAPDEEATAVIKFTPADEGAAEATVSIASDSRDNATYSFTITGETPNSQGTITNVVYSAWIAQPDGGRKTPNVGYGGTTVARCSFKSTGPNVVLTIHIQVSSNNSKNYAYVGKLDTAASSTNYFGTISGNTSSDFTMVIPSAGDHFIEILYVNNGYSASNSDYATFTIEY
jgi:hypothetical protein